MSTWPAYLEHLDSGELARRAAEAIEALQDCRVCPRDCRVDRLADARAVCLTGRRARVSTFYPHFGEELCLRGQRGSGTVFFGFCNLKCVFCQNHDISQTASSREVDPQDLASMMLELQDRGCHNINWVTPEHVVPQALEALALAAARGLRLPLVYNTSAYDSLESLEWMDGLVDIYMPDVKVWSAARGARWLKAEDYPEVARRAVLEMQRQVGALEIDARGLARRGVLVRHLVMPDGLAEAAEIFAWLAGALGRDTYVNVMDQYEPAFRAAHRPEIDRRVTSAEWREAVALARGAGLWRLEGLMT